MKIIQQKFTISYQYPVYFTEHLFQPENEIFSRFLEWQIPSGTSAKLLFVLDEEMLKHHPDLKGDITGYIQGISSATVSSFIIIPGGEMAKNDLHSLEIILKAINEEKIDRHSFVIGIGGGSVLDLAGYAASVAHRGVRHIRIPTTVLSQNDSGVGVKNGINYFGKKNFIGTFAPPAAVFNDINFLRTLDDRNWRSGIAEAVKVALIKDSGFFEWLELHAEDLVNRDSSIMAELIYRCAQLHLQHIASGDPFESGSSRPLDFGHWSAHKLEQLSEFSVLHGEAVAMGMALDVLYSQSIGWLSKEAVERILSLLERLQFKLFDSLLEKPALLNGLEEFREHLGGELTIMLLKNIGKGENIHAMDKGKMNQCIQYLREYYTNN